ncbi:aminoglycoside N(3)-acetyltransferase [Haloarcula argentinensis]|uniref:AAC(3) family N-acetyltransferase n=1 Tax=Haloarcula argentinensis TaxID=43776 RepID=A0A830FW50_HALAR|nr:AAC(3) family N-acetyltransferase [Haloarcula argentinensis]GGM42403.1 AAC(3) family N-acetyltransferase [Haloarcula argentinensis]
MDTPRPSDRSAEPVTVDSIAHDLRALGLESGETVLVHGSLSKLGWVCGGAPAVVDALQRVVTERGTVVMPTHSPGNRDPDNMGNPPVPDSWANTIRGQFPPYRPAVTPTQGMGAIAECFRTYPAVYRSKHPQHSFAAWGTDAETITGGHAYDYSLGEASPLSEVYDRDGRVLFLGTSHATNTSLHLAEYRADIDTDTTRHASAVLVEGEREWCHWTDIELTDTDFQACGDAFERAHPSAVETGTVGVGESKLLDQQPMVDFAADWLAANRS